jgi:FtsH-binding integral membrane protein
LIIFGIALGNIFGLGLFVCLLLLIILQIVALFTKGYSMMHKVISVFSLCLFSLYIVYDTNTILQKNYNGDFISASLAYYLDIINIFIDLING